MTIIWMKETFDDKKTHNKLSPPFISLFLIYFLITSNAESFQPDLKRKEIE
jgi:hypothetical protein